MKDSDWDYQFFTKVPAIILWGCFGGLVSAALYFFLQAIWGPILARNPAISSVNQFQMIGLFLILFWVLGMPLSDLFRSGSSNRFTVVYTGLLSGVCTGFLLTSVIVVFDMVYHAPGVFSVTDPFFGRVFLFRLFHMWRIPLAGLIIVSGILQALSAWYRSSRRGNIPGSTQNPQTPSIAGRLHPYRYLAITFFAILIIPPGLVHLALISGVIENKNPCCPVFDSVKASRTGPDTIRIIFSINPELSRPKTGTIRQLNITVNGNDLSTQQIISQKRLNDTINPPEGLSYRDGSAVVLHGDDIAGNETGTVHLNVIASYPDLDYKAVICDMKI
jgi:hypothetical protein